MKLPTTHTFNFPPYARAHQPRDLLASCPPPPLGTVATSNTTYFVAISFFPPPHRTRCSRYFCSSFRQTFLDDGRASHSKSFIVATTRFQRTARRALLPFSSSHRVDGIRDGVDRPRCSRSNFFLRNQTVDGDRSVKVNLVRAEFLRLNYRRCANIIKCIVYISTV